MKTNLKPAPLRKNATLLDRIEYVFQWLVSWVVIHDPEHPCLSGMLTGLLLVVPLWGVPLMVGLIWHAFGHWK